jgi:polar amino acid transport system substrate-binding protein
MIFVKHFVSPLARAIAVGALLAPTALFALNVDLSPEQKERLRVEKVPEAVATISKDAKLAEEGTLTVATTPFELPLDALANDTKTPIGTSPTSRSWSRTASGSSLRLSRSPGQIGRWAWRPANSTRSSPT